MYTLLKVHSVSVLLREFYMQYFRYFFASIVLISADFLIRKKKEKKRQSKEKLFCSKHRNTAADSTYGLREFMFLWKSEHRLPLFQNSQGKEEHRDLKSRNNDAVPFPILVPDGF